MGCHTWFFRPIIEGEEIVDHNSRYERGGKYTDNSLPHDMFRLGGYPEDVLTSFEETMKYIEERKDKMSFTDNWETKLKKFWDENPNGFIEFG